MAAAAIKSVLLCTAIFLLLTTSTMNLAFGQPADPTFFLDCSDTPPAVSSAPPTKNAECALGSVTSVPSPWGGATFTIGDDKSTAIFLMHGPGVPTEVAGTYQVLDKTTATALAQGSFGPVVLKSGDCTKPDIVAGSGTASKGEKVSKDDVIELDITFTSMFKETVCTSAVPGSTSVSVFASCDDAGSDCVSVPEFGVPAIIPAAIVFVALLTALRARHLLGRRTPLARE